MVYTQTQTKGLRWERRVSLSLVCMCLIVCTVYRWLEEKRIFSRGMRTMTSSNGVEFLSRLRDLYSSDSILNPLNRNPMRRHNINNVLE